DDHAAARVAAQRIEEDRTIAGTDPPQELAQLRWRVLVEETLGRDPLLAAGAANVIVRLRKEEIDRRLEVLVGVGLAGGVRCRRSLPIFAPRLQRRRKDALAGRSLVHSEDALLAVRI